MGISKETSNSKSGDAAKRVRTFVFSEQKHVAIGAEDRLVQIPLRDLQVARQEVFLPIVEPLFRVFVIVNVLPGQGVACRLTDRLARVRYGEYQGGFVRPAA